MFGTVLRRVTSDGDGLRLVRVYVRESRTVRSRVSVTPIYGKARTLRSVLRGLVSVRVNSICVYYFLVRLCRQRRVYGSLVLSISLDDGVARGFLVRFLQSSLLSGREVYRGLRKDRKYLRFVKRVKCGLLPKFVGGFRTISRLIGNVYSRLYLYVIEGASFFVRRTVYRIFGNLHRSYG